MNRRRDETIALGSAAAFLALAAAVVTGAATRLDRYAVGHWMPWLRPTRQRLIDLRGVFVPHTGGTLGHTLVDLWTYPASPFVSVLVVGGCAYAGSRAGRHRAAVSLCALWVVGNIVELTAKLVLERPTLGVSGFRHSYPSGHTLRAFILAAALAWLWPRAGAVAALWALSVPFALVLLGAHTPTDVVGGLLLAVCLIAASSRYRREPRPASLELPDDPDQQSRPCMRPL